MNNLLLSVLAGFLSVFNISTSSKSPPVLLSPTSAPTFVVVITPIPTIKPKVKITTNDTGSKVNCTGPDGKTFLTTQAECDKFNADWGKTKTTTNTNITTGNEMVSCRISANCGGGVRYISKTECSNSTCCQVGYNWSLFNSLQKCKDEQNKNNTGSYVRPTSIPIQTYQPVSTSAPAPTNPPVVQNSKTKTQCQEEVRLKYQALQSQYGGGSALEAINQNYNAEMNSCNQYP